MEKIALIRYSEAFKRQVVREYEVGVSASRLRAKYGIKGGSTISTWIKQYGREGSRYEMIVIQKPEERNEVKALKKRVQELESALAQTMFRITSYNVCYTKLLRISYQPQISLIVHPACCSSLLAWARSSRPPRPAST